MLFLQSLETTIYCLCKFITSEHLIGIASYNIDVAFLCSLFHWYIVFKVHLYYSMPWYWYFISCYCQMMLHCLAISRCIYPFSRMPASNARSPKLTSLQPWNYLLCVMSLPIVLGYIPWNLEPKKTFFPQVTVVRTNWNWKTIDLFLT